MLLLLSLLPLLLPHTVILYLTMLLLVQKRCILESEHALLPIPRSQGSASMEQVSWSPLSERVKDEILVL